MYLATDFHCYHRVIVNILFLVISNHVLSGSEGTARNLRFLTTFGMTHCVRLLRPLRLRSGSSQWQL